MSPLMYLAVSFVGAQDTPHPEGWRGRRSGGRAPLAQQRKAGTGQSGRSCNAHLRPLAANCSRPRKGPASTAPTAKRILDAATAKKFASFPDHPVHRSRQRAAGSDARKRVRVAASASAGQDRLARKVGVSAERRGLGYHLRRTGDTARTANAEFTTRFRVTEHGLIPWTTHRTFPCDCSALSGRRIAAGRWPDIRLLTQERSIPRDGHPQQLARGKTSALRYELRFPASTLASCQRLTSAYTARVTTAGESSCTSKSTPAAERTG